MADTVVLKKEDAIFIQEQFDLLTNKIKDLQEELELYKAECEPKDIKDILNLDEVINILEKKDKPQEDEELQSNDLSRIVG